jgi:hypothetical protein
MKTMRNLLFYHAAVYVRTTKYVMPVAALLIFLAGLYGMAPVEVVDSYGLSMTIFFFILVWIGLTHTEVEDSVSQQLLILKLGKAWKYYASNTLFLFGVSACLGLFATLLPLVSNVTHHFRLYTRPLTAPDMLAAFALHSFVGFMGACVGALFHPRIVKDRKLALLLTAFVAVIGLVKIGIHRMFPLAAALTWLFPPISYMARLLNGQDVFAGASVAWILGISALYGTLAAGLQWALLTKAKF